MLEGGVLSLPLGKLYHIRALEDGKGGSICFLEVGRGKGLVSFGYDVL